MKNEKIIVELELKKVNDANKETEKLIENLEKARKLIDEIGGNKIYIIFNYNKQLEGIYKDKEFAEKYCKHLNKNTDKKYYICDFEIQYTSNISNDFFDTLEESMNEYDETLKNLGDD